MSNITREEAREIAKEAVIEAFERLGIDAENYLETQQDLHFLRHARKLWLALVTTVIFNAFMAASWVKTAVAKASE